MAIGRGSNTGLYAEGVTLGYGQGECHRAMGEESDTGLWAEIVTQGYGRRE